MNKQVRVLSSLACVLRKMLALLLVLMLAMSGTALAHSGRTDSRGGHKDNKNKSGLGSYHYHCNGKPAHLHSGGICPYDPKDKISVNNMPKKMYVGDKVDLSWSVDAYSGSDYVEWSSSDDSVVKITSKGQITALSPGQAKITAILRNGSSTYNITITNLSIKEISLAVPSTNLTVGSIIQVDATISPDNATNPKLKWTSDKEDVAIVLQDGTVVVVGEGTVTITAEAMDGSKKKKSVKLATTVDLNAGFDANAIMAQLPPLYQFSVKPGSAAAQFVQNLGLPFKWLEEVLKQGSVGKDVLRMKVRMQELGYFTEGATLSENYNATTTERVKLFQKVNGLAQTGVADTEMLLLLYSDEAKENPKRK